jgi:hypothetical protein
MPNEVRHQLEQTTERSIYNKWISNKSFVTNRNEISHMGLAPTILEFIEVNNPKGRFGLGLSGIGPFKMRGPNYIQYMNENLKNHSNFYERFWLKE